MAINGVYQLYSDNVVRGLTPTLTTGTADADYPITNITDGLLYVPAKVAPAGNAVAIVFDLTSPTHVELVSLGHLSDMTGATCAVQGNATNAWGAPTLSVALSLPTAAEDGQRVCPFLDLSTQASHSFRYWRLAFAGVSGTFQLGEVWFGAQLRSLGVNYQVPFTEREDHGRITHETEYGIRHVFDKVIRQRRWIGNVRATSTDLAGLRSAYRSARGSTRLGLWVPDPEVNDAWWGRWDTTWSVTTQYTEVYDLGIEFLEEGRGMAL